MDTVERDLCAATGATKPRGVGALLDSITDSILRFHRQPTGRNYGLLRTEVITEFDQLVALTDEWRDLLARSPLAEPVLTPTWLLNWWRVFGERKGRRLSAITFRASDGRLVGLAPLLCRVALRARLVPFRRVEFLGSGETHDDEISSNFLGLIVERGQETNVATQLVAILCGESQRCWDELKLNELNASDPMLEPLEQALRGAGCRLERTAAGASPFLSLPHSWEEHLESICYRRRYYLRRTMRELEQWAGSDGYHLHVAEGADRARGMHILRTLHARRWAGQREGGAYGSPLFTDFHDRVGRELTGTDGVIEYMWLEARGRPIAALYNIIYRGRVYFYQSGRAMWVPRSQRPGIAIHILAIQRAIAAGHREYDFLGNEVHYKKRLAPLLRPRIHLRALAPTLRARGLETTRSFGRELARYLNLGPSSAHVAPQR